MISPVYPCFWFDNQAGDAAGFYCSLFRNSQILAQNQVTFLLEINGLKVMALNGGPVFRINPSISLFVTCETREEVTRLWNALIDGGSAMIPLDTYPWSRWYGWLQDRYGVTWQISWYGDERNEFRIIPCMLFVGERFGQAAEAIRCYTLAFENSSSGFMAVYPEGDVNAGKTMYAEFSLAHSVIAAMDGPGEHGYTFDEGVSLVALCDSQEEIDHLWDKLTEGGEESMCGWLKDRFGVSWQIVPKILTEIMNDQEKAPLAFNAFRNMKKLDIATIITSVS